MVTLIVVLTVVVSLVLFSRQEYVGRLAFSAYHVAHHRQYYRLLTHMFVHGSLTHLFINMLVFWSFGSFLTQVFDFLGSAGELRFASLHFLMVYFGGGVLAAALSIRAKRDDPWAMSVGASGGVASVLFASIFFAPWQKILLFGVLPIPGIICGAGYLLYEWYAARRGGDGIDHRAHIYGAIFGLVYPVLINPHFFVRFLRQLVSISWW